MAERWSAMGLERMSGQADGSGGFLDQWTRLGRLYCQVVKHAPKISQSSGVEQQVLQQRLRVKGCRLGEERCPRAGDRLVGRLVLVVRMVWEEADGVRVLTEEVTG